MHNRLIICDYTLEHFEDNSSLAKWSSLDLLAEEDDGASPVVPTNNVEGNIFHSLFLLSN